MLVCLYALCVVWSLGLVLFQLLLLLLTAWVSAVWGMRCWKRWRRWSSLLARLLLQALRAWYCAA